MTEVVATNQTILVVGGGISGMTAALEAAECGKQVILARTQVATLGGRTALLYRYFPKMCHPTCGLEINLRRLKANRNIRVLTLAEVSGVSGRRGDYSGDAENLAALCQRELHRLRRLRGKAVERGDSQPLRIRPGQDAGGLPAARHGLSAALCARSLHHRHADADKARAACKYGAIDLDMQARDDRNQGRRRSSGPPAGSLTTRRRYSLTAMAVSPT